ncbi:gluconate 2-dehydrogenase subunit 3 family protein [Oceanobacillus alkalisoli]|uniref:gluconate 2-dehydrogenase subunit 3 family protein n=1 Tax=Oceanobacillus alkalisoli TaxID=2925113 RepID=UPI001F11C418|nr:gluconate 2-dehydrogenase subunit 3 family protein [Oceanobacillus alkalisoli]MCF3943042.1 gluconate 2-dehydrogenase subunit 3 family protein [Oceanobacillus alkalisoli]
MANENANNKKTMNRRIFMKNAGIFTGGIVGGSILGGILSNPFLKEESESSQPAVESAEDFQEARIFFDRFEDFVILRAAVERIYPEDDNGPGAVALGVPYFIDKQLAGSWGTNAKEYMQNPFKVNGDSEDVMRYETPLNRGQIIIEGLRKIDAVSEEQFGENFVNIDGEQQDEILQSFDNGEVELTGVSSQQFFSILRKMTIEGAFADPLYGGNKNMDGWRMVEYPGPRPGFIDIIEEEEFIKMDPLGLKDYQQS